MTSPTLILAELQKYRGGEFVPTYSPTATNYRLELTKEGWFYQTESGQRLGGRNGTVYAADAHAHIELAAIEVANTEGMFLLKSGGTYAVVSDVGHATMWYDTRADALLAAVKGINEKENA